MSDRLTDRLISPPARASARKRAYTGAETNVETNTRGSRDPLDAGQEARPRTEAYTVEQVAKALNVGRDKVYELLRTNQLRSVKIGRLRRITDQHLAEFLASLEGDTPGRRTL
jgi:excisionase family DNA binding protein